LKISILGGGFGIYGYLPAARSLGWEVATLAKYSQSIQSRPELSTYFDSIQFVESESDLFRFKSALVFARTPKLQSKFISDYVNSSSNFSHFFLEKPLADSISNSQLVMNLLIDYRKSFSVGYLFQYTDWFMDLENLCANEGNRIHIDWRIPFTKSDWKNSQVDGGGLYRFFLVHFVPLLTKLGFPISDLEISTNDEKCILKGKGKNEIKISAQIVTESFHFEIRVNEKLESIFQAQTPFGLKPQRATLDPRITPLKRYLITSLNGTVSLDSTLETERNVIQFLNLCYLDTKKSSY
jgi:predicted dehydrogenase